MKEKFTVNDFDEWINYEETLDKQFDCFFKPNSTKVTSPGKFANNTPNLSSTICCFKTHTYSKQPGKVTNQSINSNEIDHDVSVPSGKSRTNLSFQLQRIKSFIFSLKIML